ncbi:Histone chaperone Rttp106-like [Metschnikowia aff. pulcherrima]|uniref:Histone chaperone Rttp106-like n=1 Tax=Metschnikowia aff. pulcherrima TaxID=2163413 RepID=A0A4P6XFY3_9ASCO|nr:Histone chaperone Rttp106-like [Metschnikowia aff. pulcherrima]
MATWIDELPSDHQEVARALLRNNPESASLLLQLGTLLAAEAKEKRRKIQLEEVVSKHVLKIKRRIPAYETIFQLTGLSFLCPARCKLKLVFHFHVGEDKIGNIALSVVDATTEIPKISIIHPLSTTELFMMIPILGNSTNLKKKDTVMTVLWFKDAVAVTEGENEPILCTLDLDVVKKQLIDAKKLPPDAEAHFLTSSTNKMALKPINDLIADFLLRQFGRFGVKLLNLLPSASPCKNSFNMNDEDVICLSKNADKHNDLVMVAAYKASKEGRLVLVANSSECVFLVFGFNQPDFLIKSTTVKAVSYSSITRSTFSMWVTVVDTDGEEVSHGFARIAQKSFQAIDDFVKRMNMNDNPLDEKHREKRADNTNEAVEEGTCIVEGEPISTDDEEEDDIYMDAVEEQGSGSGSGSEVDEEFIVRGYGIR